MSGAILAHHFTIRRLDERCPRHRRQHYAQDTFSLPMRSARCPQNNYCHRQSHHLLSVSPWISYSDKQDEQTPSAVGRLV